MPQTYEKYLEKRALFPPWIQEVPKKDLAICVVIPAYHEEELWQTLDSLMACDPIEQSVEVIVVLNDRADERPSIENFHSNQIKEYEEKLKFFLSDFLTFRLIHASGLPIKKAGVGLARKIGMDEAVRRFQQVEQSGLIVALDGDTLVSKNYFQAIQLHFKNNPNCPAASIRYAHRLEGLSAGQCRAIVQYELHLRIFLAAKRWTGFPFAFETIGSAMAVRSEVYCAQGGMNTRKAGEDFYFLNKFIPLGGFAEINSTTVFPSARMSERVPFGTGRAIKDTLDSQKNWMTYAPRSFAPLKTLFANIDELSATGVSLISDKTLATYLEKEKFMDVVGEIKSNTASKAAFRKRFFRWFDAFRLMKYLHFAIEQGEQKVEILEAGRWLWQEVYQEKVWPAKNEADLEQWLLDQLRKRLDPI